MSEDEINKLLASIWLWGNLGGIGQRSRRGFGSPVIEVEKNNNIFEELDLPVKQVFDNKNNKELKDYLKKGINTIWKLFNVTYNTVPKDALFFTLKSLKQVSVGNKPYHNIDKALQEVHGKNECEGLGCIRPARIASPIILRFHQVRNYNKVQFLPVVTWCHQKFDIKNLKGKIVNVKRIPHDNCLKAYLKGEKCNCGQSLPNNLGFSHYLTGAPI